MARTVILLIGLPGAGKTTLAQQITHVRHDIEHINADAVRKAANDWDFSPEGRLRQTRRMRDAARASYYPTALIDQVCPLVSLRQEVGANVTIWLNTIARTDSRFADTAALWEEPTAEEKANPGFFQLDRYIPNPDVLDFINAVSPRHRTSNGRASYEFQMGIRRDLEGNLC
jgi:adenylylsulfate kinase